MATNLLQALGLPPTAAAKPASQPAAQPAAQPGGPTGAAAPPSTPAPDALNQGRMPKVTRPDGKPIDLNLPKFGDPAANRPAGPDLKLPADPKKQVQLLGEAIVKVQDVVKRDVLVRKLRDSIAKLQPVVSDEKAKKAIDEAIDSLVQKGSKELLSKLLQTLVGKAPTAMPADADRGQIGPAVREKDVGRHEFMLPAMPLPFDQPPKVRRSGFEFRNLPGSSKQGGSIAFRLLTPDSYVPGQHGATRVVLIEAADRQQNGSSATRVSEVDVEGKGDVRLSLSIPDKPGDYLVIVSLGGSLEGYTQTPIKVLAK